MLLLLQLKYILVGTALYYQLDKALVVQEEQEAIHLTVAPLGSLV